MGFAQGAFMKRLTQAFRMNYCKVLPLLLLLVGTIGSANAAISPTSLSCPNTSVGSSASCGSVTESESGTIAIASSNANFSISAGTCTGSASACTFSVNIVPQTTGSLSATITFSRTNYECVHGAPCQFITHNEYVSVSGTGLTPYTYSWNYGGWGSCAGGTGSWNYGSWSAPNSYCSTSATETRSASCAANAGTGSQSRSVYCQRSDGATAANSYCSGDAQQATSQSCTPSSGFSCSGTPVTSQTVSSLSGCQYNWITSGWSAPNNSCSSSATETETVQCRRSDGTIVSNSDCNASTEPPSSQTVADYSGCQYSWSSGNWGACSGGSGTWQYSSWTPATGSACTSSLSQTRTASCVANSGSGSQSRTETCMRSDGTAVSSSYCSGTAEPATSESCTPSSGFSCGTEGATSQTVSDYGGCTYSWITGSWSAPSSSCSSSATETRSVQCQRSDGTIEPNSDCPASTEPASSQTVADYSSCTYSWQMSAWSAPSNTCSSNATETRTGTCLRSDGTQVASSYCSGVTEPATSQTVADYSTCTYTWEPGSWSACSGGSGTWSYTAWSPAAGSACTASLNQTRTGTCNVTADSGSESRTVTCQRSDGTTVSGSYCTSSEPATSQACTPSSVDCGTEEPLTQTVSDYGGCSYSWQASGFGACVGGTGTWEYTAWSPTCGSGTFTQTRTASCVPNSNSATQTQTVTCLRSDGTTVAGSYCPTSSEPAASQACTPSSGYSCGTEAPLSQQVTMNTVCMAAMTACVPNPAEQKYCIVIPDK